MKRNLLVMLSIVLMLLAFISCTNDNSSKLPDTEASAVAEKIDPVQLMNDALKGKISGATVTFRQVKDAATLIAVVEFDNATYNGFKISSGRLSYTLVGDLTGSSFRATSYKVTTEVELSISEVSTGATATTVTIEVPETTTASTGSSVTATVTASTEGEVKVSVSNVSISLPSTGAQVTVGGNDVTDSIDQKPADPEPVGPTYQPISTTEELTAAITNGGYYRLTTDVALGSTANITKNLYLDLNENTLSSNYRIDVTGATLSISSGNLSITDIEGTAGNNPALMLKEGGSLILDAVAYTSDISNIFFVNQEDNTSARIINNSVIKSDGGYYAIGTNASEPEPSQNVTIEIINSEVTSAGSTGTGGDNTAILFNVNGTVTISGSTISGDRQGLILRGGSASGTHRISNSEITATGNNSVTTEYVGESWKPDKPNSWDQGNEVPLAALVIGNRSESAYRNPINVALSDVMITISEDGMNDADKAYHGIYVWQNSTDTPVSVSGSCASATTVNAEKNGAAFNVPNTVILPSDVNAEMQDFMKAFVKVNNHFQLEGEGSSRYVDSKQVASVIYDEGVGTDDMYINLGNFGTVTSVGLLGKEYTSTDDIMPVSIGNSVFYQDKVYKSDSEENLLVNKAALMFSLIAGTGIEVNGTSLEGYSLYAASDTDLSITEVSTASGSGTVEEGAAGTYDVNLTGPNVNIRYKYGNMTSGDIIYVITKQGEEITQNSLLIADGNGAYAYLTPWNEAVEAGQSWIAGKVGTVLNADGSYKGTYNLTFNVTTGPQA